MGCSLPGFSVHGILQARMLECHFLLQGNESFWSRDQTQVSCIAGEFFTIWDTRKVLSGLFFDPQKRQRKLLQGPKHTSHPESLSHSLESFFNLYVFCLLPKCPYSRWLMLPGAICETLKMGRKGTGVESFRWKTHGSANNSWREGLLGQVEPFPGHVWWPHHWLAALCRTVCRLPVVWQPPTEAREGDGTYLNRVHVLGLQEVVTPVSL